MKRKWILSAGAVLLAGMFSIFAYFSSKKDSVDNLLNANVEALANGESEEIVKCYCKVRWFQPTVCSVQGDGGYCGGNPCSNYDGNCR